MNGTHRRPMVATVRAAVATGRFEVPLHRTSGTRGSGSAARRNLLRRSLPAWPRLELAESLRAKTNLGVAIAGLFVLSPFAANHLIRGRLLLGLASASIVAILTVNAWCILQGRMVRWLTPAVLVPAIAGFLVMCFRHQGVIAVFWSYPALISFYFMLPPKQARIANLVLLTVVIPEAMVELPPDLTIRFGATLLAVSIFSGIFVCVLSRQEQQLRRLAVTDQLTGLLNRKTLEPTLTKALEQSRRSNTPMALISIDLDHFKPINDTFGHDAGDRVLRAVSGVLRDRLRGSDQVFRVGGEEFLAVLYGANEEQAGKLAEELRTRVSSLHVLPDLRVTASFGVAGLRPGEEWEHWLKRVDTLLYRAKSAGRNQVVADTPLADAAMSEARLTT